MRRILGAVVVAILALTGVVVTAAPANAAQITIQGTIRQNGVGVPGITVELYTWDGTSHEWAGPTTADGSGHYSITALSDTLTYTIAVAGSNGFAKTWYGNQGFEWNATHFTGDTTADIDMIPGGTLTVTVVGGPTKTPLAGVITNLCHHEGEHSWCAGGGILTDAGGHTTLTGLAPGAWLPQFVKTGYPAEYYNNWAVDAAGPFDTVEVTTGNTTQVAAWLRTDVTPSYTFFQDVPSSSTFYPAIDWVAQQGISTGTPVQYERPLYKPLDAVSRQAMAQFLYRMDGATFTPPVTAHFADVPTSSTFYTAIEWMYSLGLSTGTPQPSGLPLFKPIDPVSRQAMASFLYRYDDGSFTPPVTPSFADVPTSSTFYEAIEWMIAADISTGTPNPPGKPLYKPLDPVSRQAMALFLQRYAA